VSLKQKISLGNCTTVIEYPLLDLKTKRYNKKNGAKNKIVPVAFLEKNSLCLVLYGYKVF